jgi:hypothetical protein
MKPWVAVSGRLVVLVLAAGLFLGLGLHHHDSGSPEAPCAVCHFVVSLMPVATAVVAILVMSSLAWALWQPPAVDPSTLLFASCGLRAPPVLL